MPAIDDYSTLSGKAWNAPASSAVAVAPSDTVDLTHVSRWLFVGGLGNVTATLADGSGDVLLTAVAAGTLLPMRFSRVKATGTTATNIVALW